MGGRVVRKHGLAGKTGNAKNSEKTGETMSVIQKRRKNGLLTVGIFAVMLAGAAIAAIITGVSTGLATPGQTTQCDSCHTYPGAHITMAATVASNTVATGATFPVNITWSGGSSTAVTEINWPTTFTTVTRDNTLFNPLPRIPSSGLNLPSGTTSSTLTAPTTPGTYTVRVYAATIVSPAPQETAYQDITINVVAPPAVSAITATPNPTNGAATVSLSATVSSSGSTITAAEYFIDAVGSNGAGTAMTGTFGTASVPVSATINTSALTFGGHTIYVHGKDASGTWGPTGAISLSVSSGALGPLTSNVRVTPNPTAGATTATLSANVTASGSVTVAGGEYFIDMVGPNGYGTAMTGTYSGTTGTVTATISVTGLAVGSHTAYVQGKDSVGNWGPIVAGAFSVSAGTTPTDTLGPLTSSPGATPNPTNGASSVSLSATFSDATTGNSNVGGAEYYIDAAGPNGSGTPMTGNFTTATVTATASASVAGLSNASHVAYIHGKDAAGNWGPIISTSFAVSPLPGPVTSSVAATPNPTGTATSVTLTASITDVNNGNYNVTAAEYFIDTVGATGTGTAMTGSFTSPTVSVTSTVNVSALSVGNHTMYVRGKDANGFWGSTASVVLAKSANPITSNVAATPNPTNGATSVTLTASITEATTGNNNIAAAEYFIDTVGANGAGIAMTGTFTSPTVSVTASVNVSGLSNATHTIYVHGKDALGNWGLTSSASLSVTPPPAVPPAVTTGSAINITGTSATLQGTLTSLGSATYANVSIQWGTSTSNYTSETLQSTMGTTGAFQANISGLTAGKTYYFRAKAVGSTTAYGSELSFTATAPAGAPAVTTQSAISVTSTAATLSASLSSLGNASYVNVYFQWSTTSGTYTGQTTPTTMGTTGVVQANITGLTTKTTYYFRAVAVGSSTTYGAELSFTTP